MLFIGGFIQRAGRWGMDYGRRGRSIERIIVRERLPDGRFQSIKLICGVGFAWKKAAAYELHHITSESWTDSHCSDSRLTDIGMLWRERRTAKTLWDARSGNVKAGIKRY